MPRRSSMKSIRSTHVEITSREPLKPSETTVPSKADPPKPSDKTTKRYKSKRASHPAEPRCDLPKGDANLQQSECRRHERRASTLLPLAPEHQSPLEELSLKVPSPTTIHSLGDVLSLAFNNPDASAVRSTYDALFFLRERDSELDEEKGLLHKVELTPAAVCILYHVYLLCSVWITWEGPEAWCYNVRFLVLVTVLAYLTLALYIVTAYAEKKIDVFCPTEDGILATACWRVVVAGAVVNAFWQTRGEGKRLYALAGILILLMLPVFLSRRRDRISWTRVSRGVGQWYFMAVFIVNSDACTAVLRCLNDKLVAFADFTKVGTRFMFGEFVTGLDVLDRQGSNSTTAVVNGYRLELFKPIFMFVVLPKLLFVNFVINMAYSFQWARNIIELAGAVLRMLLGVTFCEALAGTVSVFLDMNESTLFIQPYLPYVTTSELFTVLTCGCATMSAIAVAGFADLGLDAGHVMKAALLGSVGSLFYSKLLCPEVHAILVTHGHLEVPKKTLPSALAAASTAATVGLKICCFQLAAIVVFICFYDFANSVLIAAAENVGYTGVTLEWAAGRLLRPMVMFLGVSRKDSEIIAKAIATKVLENEFVAATWLSNQMQHIEERTTTIAAYALCGFGNLASVTVYLGLLRVLCPDRLEQLLPILVPAAFTGNAVSLLNACLVGLVI